MSYQHQGGQQNDRYASYVYGNIDLRWLSATAVFWVAMVELDYDDTRHTVYVSLDPERA
jgi:hypothetical protein